MLIENQTVLLKTYLYPSGLFYLASLLKKELEKYNNKVIYIPKEKYIQDGLVWKPTYKYDTTEEYIKFSEFEGIQGCTLSALNKTNAKTLISFETLMEKSSWLSRIKSQKRISIYDVPMIEWVTQSLLDNGSYTLFDKVLCFNEQTQNIFKEKNLNTALLNLDLVDRSLFFNELKLPNSFFHIVSLNDQYSSKNTKLVLEAFVSLAKKNKDVTLRHTGPEIIKHERIRALGNLDRNDFAEEMRMNEFLLMPSSREGLGLPLYEAKACKTKIITTDHFPMNIIDTPYLIKPTSLRYK